MIYDRPRFLHSGDENVTVELGDEMTLEANFKVIALNQAIRESGLDGLHETFPGWRSLLLSFDSLTIRYQDLIAELEKIIETVKEVNQVPSRLIELPVQYGGQWASDLEFVAAQNDISTDEVIRLHSQTIHWTGMVGFTPGSPQLMQLNPERLLSVPKYISPRIYTPRGCVALGGSITAIYPVVSPGGYQMIGLTPVPIYDRYQSLEAFEDSPVLLKIGDRIRFVPVAGDEYDHIRQEVWEYTYRIRIEEGTFRLPRGGGR